MNDLDAFGWHLAPVAYHWHGLQADKWTDDEENEKWGLTDIVARVVQIIDGIVAGRDETCHIHVYAECYVAVDGKVLKKL